MVTLSDYAIVQAPDRTSRLIPSQFPPVATIDTVTDPRDLEAVLDLEGWTNDRIASPRITRLPFNQWAIGRPNASVVMAAFMHGSPNGLRFSSADLGAWYGSTGVETCIVEVANGIRKELSLSGMRRLSSVYREYKARLVGDFVDIKGHHCEFHDPDDRSYPAPQAFGQEIRLMTGVAGIRYESVRRRGHDNWVSFHPRQVLDVVQAVHYELAVPQTGKVTVRRLT